MVQVKLSSINSKTHLPSWFGSERERYSMRVWCVYIFWPERVQSALGRDWSLLYTGDQIGLAHRARICVRSTNCVRTVDLVKPLCMWTPSHSPVFTHVFDHVSWCVSSVAPTNNTRSWLLDPPPTPAPPARRFRIANNWHYQLPGAGAIVQFRCSY